MLAQLFLMTFLSVRW